MRFRIVRRIRGLLVDIPNPLQPGSTGCVMSADDVPGVLANARRIGLFGVEAIPEEQYRMERAS